jgi:DNA-binding MarR family transcriptional regulator
MSAVVTEKDGDGETLQVWKRLWALAYGLDTRSKQMVEAMGVTAEEWLILRIIGERPRCTPRMLAAALNLQPRTLGGILRRLELGRYIMYRPHSEDRRAGVLVLTPRGMRVGRERRGTVEAAVRRTLERLEVREIAGSAKLLELLASELRSD